MVNAGLIAVVDGNGRGWFNLVFGVAAAIGFAVALCRRGRPGGFRLGWLTDTPRRPVALLVVVLAVGAALVAIGWRASIDRDAAWPAALTAAVVLIWIAALAGIWSLAKKDEASLAT